MSEFDDSAECTDDSDFGDLFDESGCRVSDDKFDDADFNDLLELE